MPKPLHDMGLPEVLEILTPPQRNSVLAYARQLARSTLSPNPSWLVDGRVSKTGKAQRPSASNRTAEAGRLVKCSECGLRVDEREIKKHWDSKHLAKKQKKPSRGKGIKVSNEVSLKKPRLVQGGLCNPR
jgi:hypothetical protein